MILEEPTQIAEVSDVFLSRLDDPRGMYPWQAIVGALGRFTCLEISRFASGGRQYASAYHQRPGI